MDATFVGELPVVSTKLPADTSSRFINKELSLLAFIERVLEQASRRDQPLLEQLRFIVLAASYLDEFYSVEVGDVVAKPRKKIGLLSPHGLTIAQLLSAIHERSGALIDAQHNAWREMRDHLRDAGIAVLEPTQLEESDRIWLEEWFMERIFPIVTPLPLDPTHSFPFIANMALCIILELTQEVDGSTTHALLPLPAQIDRFVRLPPRDEHDDKIRFVILEGLITMNLPRLFPGHTLAKRGLFRMIRDDNLNFERDGFYANSKDLVSSYETILKRRRRGQPLCLAITTDTPADMAELVANQTRTDNTEVFFVNGMLGLKDLHQLIVDDRPDLLFNPYTPRFPERILGFGDDLFATIRTKDIAIHHPYESFDPVVHFVQKAARDPDVLMIKQTLYRTSRESPIVRALISAAEQGKSIIVLVELTAPFDEEHNIAITRQLTAAGIHVIHGFVGLEIHAKFCLVERREKGTLRSYLHFGTGNYHPETARIFADVSFFTAEPGVTGDLTRLFNFLAGYTEPQNMQSISFSPFTIRQTLMGLIEQEIAFAQEGRPAGIWLKMNRLTDEQLIEALYRASDAGVQVDCIVRSTCCLRPGVPGLSSNIRVKSIVGRFLEHSRIYVFGNGHRLPSRQARVFVASADWMTRNMIERVETMVPIEDTTVRAQILYRIMIVNLKDTAQSWMLGPDAIYRHLDSGPKSFSSHNWFMTNPSLSGPHNALQPAISKISYPKPCAVAKNLKSSCSKPQSENN